MSAEKPDTNTRSSDARSDVIRNTLGLLPMVALSAALTAPAYAQGTDSQSNNLVLDEIRIQGETGGYKRDRVQSNKATAPLLNTPRTVTVIPREVIEEQGATDLTEVLRNTPGITFDAGENGFSTSTNNFKLRGFDGSGNIFIDGARDSGSYSRDIFNIEQVEVVKGPAAENGRGGAGGYVNMATKTPTTRNFINGSADLKFDDYGTEMFKRATVDANQVFGPVALRLNGMIEGGGLMGRDTARARAWGIAPSIAYGLGTDFRATLAYEHLTRRDRPDWGVPGVMAKGMVNHNPVAAQADRDSFFGLKSDFDRIRADSVLAKVEYDINSAVTISNQTRWSQIDHNARYTVPTGYTPATRLVGTQTQFYGREGKSLTNQTNVAANFTTGSVRHSLAAGVEFSHETSNALRFGTANGGDTPIFNPNPNRIAGPNGAPTQNADIRVNTVAAYLYDTIHLTDQLLVSGGLRAERYSVKMGSTVLATGRPATSQNGVDDSYNTLGGSLGLAYKPTPDGTLYVSYALSHTPPNSYLSNPDISRTGDNAFPGFVAGAKPVRIHNYEAGVKWDVINGGLQLGAALFRTEKHRAPITGRDAGETADTLKGYGKQIVQGVELSVAGKVTSAWSVFGGLSVMDSERKHSAYLDQVRRNANPADYGAVLRTSGDELAFTPKLTANLWSTYDLTEQFTVGAGVQYVGKSWLGRPDDANRIIPNGRFGKLPSYFLANAMASYDITENAKIRVNVDNIFNKKYVVSSNWAGSRVALGAARTYTVGANIKF